VNDYQKMANIIEYLATHSSDQTSLTTLADMADLSPYYFQRKFTEWVGVSPKSYLQCLTLESARTLLIRNNSVVDVALDTGLSGPGRLHDLCVTLDAASPGEIKSGGAGLTVHYGFGLTPFGECLLAHSRRGICYLAFVNHHEHDLAIKALKDTWPGADLIYQDETAEKLITQIFNKQHNQHAPLRALVKGTNFQLQVWRALLKIPEGGLVTYGALASSIDRPRAARATGAAVGANTLAYLIPCHRVIRNTGVIGEYRWGSNRKRAIIACEIARTLE